MEPIIYALPKIDNMINIGNIYFETQPSPKLIKFGFNNISQIINLASLTENPNYRVGLNVDVERNDQASLHGIAGKYQIDKFNLDVGKIWEICALFGFVKSDKQIYCAQNISTGLKSLIHQTMPQVKWNMVKTDANLVIYQYSQVEIDENAAIGLITQKLSNLLSIQSAGSSMIIQLFGMQTSTTAEIVYYLSSYYNESYIIKPSISNNLSEEKYLVLIDLRNKPVFNIPNHPDNHYLISLDIGTVPILLVNNIQCINSNIILKIYRTYATIKEYLDMKIYDGNRYNELYDLQTDNMVKWFDQFVKDIVHIDKITDSQIKKSTDKCVTYDALIKLLA